MSEDILQQLGVVRPCENRKTDEEPLMLTSPVISTLAATLFDEIEPEPGKIRALDIHQAIGAPERKRKVLVVYTGGTLGMRKNMATGSYEPSVGFLEEYVCSALNPQWPDDPMMPILELNSIFSPPLDSSDVGPKEWCQIGQLIYDEYNNEYDGFVIVHGTDTLALTSSAVAFMLVNLAKPVVFTGAQIPLEDPRSDGKSNMIDSVLIAAHSRIAEVCVVFGSKVMRATRVQKVDAWSTIAFDSPNYPQLGSGGIHLSVNTRRLRASPPDDCKLRMEGCMSDEVCIVWVYPGVMDVVRAVIDMGKWKGLILVGYGTGTIPADELLLKSLKNGLENGMVVVVVTQCQVGTTILTQYENGRKLMKAGATSGCDMTIDAAYTKLCWLLGQDLSVDTVRRLMTTDLRGELSGDIALNQASRGHTIIY